ncbi:MAG: lipid-A-disaccharide synthase [Burkholderiaceae bacterium]
MSPTDTTATDRLVWVAGEKSGDLIAGPILAALNERLPGVSHQGIGGPEMREAGMECWWDINDLSVRGYAEVLTALPRLLNMRRRLANKILADPPSMFVGVDAPDFNFALERKLRKRGVRCTHFIGPSVWAWRAGRLKSIRDSVDHMLLLFPFEKPLYDEAGIDATFVGHPLADKIAALDQDRAAARARLGLTDREQVIALLPGSRGSEIRYMGRTFLETARWVFSKRHDIQFVLPAANQSILESLRNEAAAMGLADSPHLHLVHGHAYDSMIAADSVLVASGTATLEVALFQKPMVIAYKMAPTSYQLMKRMGYLPYVGLPNILCSDWVVPEYLQDAANAPALGSALLEQLDDETHREQIVTRFAQLQEELAVGCAGRVAEVLGNLVRPC